ncbi:MAG TPA: DUF5666 domain-containing protein [bacterium]|nr:DUF5666 domain-containing protein [bacterium]
MKKIVMVVAGLALAAGLAHAEVKIKGAATKVDGANGTLTVAGLAVDAKNASVTNPLLQKIKLSEIPAGQRVYVRGEFGDDGGFVARHVSTDFGKDDELEAGIDAVDAASKTYTVGSIAVVAAPGAEIEVKDDAFGAYDQMAIGRKIEAEGRWSADRRLSASKIKIE